MALRPTLAATRRQHLIPKGPMSMDKQKQVDQDADTASARHALDLGITTFDTADAYAGTRAE